MKSELNHLKGIHPGFVLNRELDKRHLRKGAFALSLQEYPQTLTAITKGKRGMNTALSLKIEKALGLEEGYFMILQVYYEIEEEKRKLNKSWTNLPQLRPVLFWDTKMTSLDWEKQKKAIIKRVFERGNDIEKNEIIRFYGAKTVNDLLNKHLQNASL
jgi:plasmid maintenance system antidote protein VapI